MNVLVYDTETSGMVLWNQPSEDPGQPHIVQIGAILYDLEARKEMASMSVIVCPEGWTIPDEVAQIHGITNEIAQSSGVSERIALEMLLELEAQAGLRIGHNEAFDARIIRIAMKRFKDDLAADQWGESVGECTAKLSRPIVKAPATARMIAAGRRGAKIPTLAEAYEHFMGQPLVDAHDAMVDASAALNIYLALIDGHGHRPNGTQPAEPAKPTLPFLED